MKIKANVKIQDIKSIDEIPAYWTSEDYKTLLKSFDFSDIDTLDPAEYKDMLYMAITDFEPDEAAKILLDYKFSEELNEGQINNISHEMQEDKIAEEYPDPSFHYGLFNINQLLFKAYNGSFPAIKASKIDFQLELADHDVEITKAFLLKAIAFGLADKNLIKRLYGEALSGSVFFEEADSILWEMHEKENHCFSIITSDYWLNKEDFVAMEFNAEVIKFIKIEVED